MSLFVEMMLLSRFNRTIQALSFQRRSTNCLIPVTMVTHLERGACTRIRIWRHLIMWIRRKWHIPACPAVRWLVQSDWSVVGLYVSVHGWVGFTHICTFNFLVHSGMEHFTSYNFVHYIPCDVEKHMNGYCFDNCVPTCICWCRQRQSLWQQPTEQWRHLQSH